MRSPGHHAGRASCGGSCNFNNDACAATHALGAHGLTRVAIVDFDVPYGNGTQEIFWDDLRVLFVSTFQHAF